MRVGFAVLICLAPLLLGGCTIYGISGQGPQARVAYEHNLGSARQDDVARWRHEVARDRETSFNEGTGAAAGYTVGTRSRHSGPIVVGDWNADISYEAPPGREDSLRSLIARASIRHVGFGLLFLHWSARLFDTESGTCVMDENVTSFTPIFAWRSVTTPQDMESMLSPSVTQRARRLEHARYDNVEGFEILGGVLGAGSHDKTAYFKLLFCEIPLWDED